jgi:hypothetical protein
MAQKIRSVDFLPEIFQTPVNTQFLNATLDQLIQEPAYQQTQGFIGQRVGPGVNANDSYVIEPTKVRADYQLEPGVISLNPTTSKIDDAITYPGILDALATQGGIVNQQDRLFESEYYSWDPFVDFDKYNNYSQYYWLPNGPDLVTVTPTTIPTQKTFTVTRANGAYTFSGYKGNNPTLTLARDGNYNFVIAQNTANAVDYRVINNGTSSWAIDQTPNPTLTLVRGNTYTWNMVQTGAYKFYIKTELSFGTTNLWDNGVTNNGGSDGLITFTVPQDAPDVLYYCNDIHYNLRGQLNIVDASGGTGPQFWIQTQPGLDGRLPWSPNIDDRTVLGVSNNGIDLGTVSFDVPALTAQDFYLTLPLINYPTTGASTVDLICSTFTYSQLAGVSVETFLAENPDGIDGITNLNSRTLVFTNDTDPTAIASLWQIQYVGGLIQLNSVLNIGNNTQFSISFGTEFVNTKWYKNYAGQYEQQPLLTAALPYVYYQDSEDPTIFGQIRFITENTTSTVSPIAVTDITSTGAEVTLSFNVQNIAPYSIGSSIIVSEINPSGYNGTYSVVACTNATVTFASTETADYVSGGTINSINVNSYINVDTEILGQKNYISPNGIIFTNGLKIIFQGTVYPTSYIGNTYYVQGVGSNIVLVPESSLVVPETYAIEIDGQPTRLDYITINMASPDLNPWSRSNRWFHVDVVDVAAAYNNVQPVYVKEQRANRPILEFRAGTKLFNFGTQGISSVNVIDFTQTNALLNVAGTTGYGIDGYTLVDDSLIIFAADNNPDVRNQVYQVKFIIPDPEISTVPIIDLIPIATNPVLVNQVTVCTSGNTQTGKSFYYNGTTWETAQQKTAVNQAPLFDIFDSSGYSFGDSTQYPSTNFGGCKLLSYAENSDNTADSVLGIPLAFVSIGNIGDILFDNNLYTDTFIYTPSGSTGVTVNVSNGFVYQYLDRVIYTPEIGWQIAAIPSLARQQFQFTYSGTPLQFDVVIETDLDVPAAQIFINSVYQLPSTYTLAVNTSTNTSTITLNGTGYVVGDLIEVLIYSQQISTQAFYEIPINLENNPFNSNSSQFSLGTVRNHYGTICENLIDLQGPINGRNNTRDLGNIVPYGQLILQQSSPLTLAGYFLRSENYNIFASLEYNSREYTKYKNKLLTAITQLNLNGTESVAQILDLAIRNITTSLTSSDPFYWSDMLPTGTNYNTTITTVSPITTNVFNTTQAYNFTSSNYLGLLVYVNGVLLVRNSQYIVSTDALKLTILVPLNVGDIVTINEYPTTLASWCPNTPSKMGLYPKFMPSIFVDDTYSEPTVVIQGHDGSITIAFDDIRDQVLLEFEKRIYDNIKVDDNPIPLSTDDVNPLFYPTQTTALLPGFFRKTPYTYQEINQIMSEDFLTWVGQNKVDYTTQNYVADNPFTWNYKQAGNRVNQEAFLQGNWRGIYRYFYDTETPNSTPWEMVGFSEEPDWWVLRYGPAPYTSGNTVLWDDLEAGIVGDPAGPYLLPEYVRPGLSKIIPAGSEGELLPPSKSIMGKNNPYGFQQSWVSGDGGPVQASWWNSSAYPFAIMRMLALTKPAQFFSLYADRDLYRYNNALGQYLLNNRYRLDASDVQIYGAGTSKASYINWIVDYNQKSGVNSTTILTNALKNLDVRLCYRMASFSDPTYIQLYTERGGPGSTNNSLLIPPSSYDLLFYKNQPFNQITFSSVIVQVIQLDNGSIGYSVQGYSNVQPYFEILQSNPVGLYSTLVAGTRSVEVPTQYTTNVKQIPYGYVFTNPASVCDFLLSYGAWLSSQGLIFDNIYNGYTLTWLQMAQEFLNFAGQSWEANTIINLNPCATKITASQPISIVDTVASVTPENMLLDQNATVLDVRNLIVYRNGDLFSITTTNNQTINYLTLKFTNYEDMIVLNNTTQFNDLIYDPATAARQSRLSLIASTTTEWDGQLNAQGFILNLNNVEEWQPYTKYTKGEIVLYKNTYWQALVISEPQETFNYVEWVKSNYQVINNGLLPNLANKADQLTTTYDVYQANLTSDNDLFAFGLIGFRPRPYMTNMNLNEVTQVQIYQEFIGTKGSLRATEIFNNARLAGKENGAYSIYENWGILAGTYGAQANKSFFELQLNEALLSYNPSTIQVINPGETSQANQQIYLSNLWKESYNITSTDILPTTYEGSNTPTALPSAGYVCLDDIDVTVFSLEDPTSIDANINSIGIGTYIWIAKINPYDWGVYRVAATGATMTQLTDNLNGTSVVQFNNTHNLSTGDLIIIKYFNDAVNGVYRVLSTPTPTTIAISYSFTKTNVTTVTGTGLVLRLQSARVSQASDISTLPYVNSLVPGAIAWVDNDGYGHWETVQKQAPFTVSTSITPGVSPSNQYGSTIAQVKNNLFALVGAPAGADGAGSVLAYYKDTFGNYQFSAGIRLQAPGTSNFGNMLSFGSSNWAVIGANTSMSGMGYAVVLYRTSNTDTATLSQLLVPPDQNFSAIGFGTSGVISADENWMYIGAPGANAVYAYEKVIVENQLVRYTTANNALIYQYSNNIQIDYTQPDQLKVYLGVNADFLANNLLTNGIDYTINQDNLIFTNAPTNGQQLVIIRNDAQQLDQAFYYHLYQNSATGVGTGALFTLEDTRGFYYPSVEFGGQNYTVGDVLTINGTQINPVSLTTPANNLVITVTGTNPYGRITGFAYSGQGVENTATFTLNQYLYNATTIDNFVVSVNEVLQRPYIDYTFNTVTTELTFITVPAGGAKIYVSTPTYWQYVEKITISTLAETDNFGATVSTTTDGRQLSVGAPTTDSSAGKVYVFDRSVLRFIVSNPTQTTYTVTGSIIAPVAVSVNGVFLLTTNQSVTGQFTVSGNNIIFSNIIFNYGDIIEIETNKISLVQQLYSSTPNQNSQYGFAIDTCPLNCSLYVGAPFDSTYADLSGSVDHLVNQSRVYGITTSTIANPTITAGGTLRINDSQVIVPSGPNNTIEGLAAAINAANIPNVLATVTSNLEFISDGITKIYSIGTLYSAASSFTTVVYLDNIKQTEGVNYTYDAATESIYFIFAPSANRVITVVSGRLTISVQNLDASTPYNYITILPGTVNSVFNQLGFDTLVFTQQILSPAPVFNGQFGASLSVDTSAVNLIVGSPNGNVYEPTTFDAGQTYFDEQSTTFYNPIINGGVAYTYDFFPSSTKNINNPGQFAFGQQIYVNNSLNNIQSGDRFGTAVNYVTGELIVGATGGPITNTATGASGFVIVFKNALNTPAWTPIRVQQPVVDVYGINGVFSYNGLQAAGVNNTATSQYQTYFDFFDPLQGKILGVARSNIDFIGSVDPAQYNQGSVHNNGQAWGSEHIGQMWWDTDTVRFIDPNQDDIVYASRRWGQTFPGSVVDVYQWVESTTPPASYTGSGTPLSVISYTIASQLGQNNIFQTLYYFWVKGITTVATGSGKTLSPAAVASYILDPRSSGLPYIAGLNSSTVAIYNAQSLLTATNTILNISFDREITDAVIHQEFQIITDGDAGSFLNSQLYRKFLDSLCGLDTAGNAVPDPLLSTGMKYGVQFRPRQSMVADRFTALENYLGRANTVLAQYPISELVSFNLLNSSEPIPESNVTVSAGSLTIGTAYTILFLGTTDFTAIGAASNTIGLSFVATGSGSGSGTTTTAIWNAKVANLEILGYQNLNVVPVGYKYLVLSDSSQDGRWTIYTVTAGPTTTLTQVQSYNTPLYWYYINWYLPGYNSSIAPVAAVQNYGQLLTLSSATAPVGSSVRVNSNGEGKYEIYLRSGVDSTNDWTRVGLEDGTIAFDQSLWNYTGNFGFDAQVFDSQYFDETPQTETRYILRALNEEIYIEELLLERNSSLILMFNYIYSEFIDPSWLIKTSYVNVNHKIRSLLPYQTYLTDNQDFVVDYFQEVKPYHVQVRQFNLIYTGDDNFLGDVTDYDLPAYWKSTLEDPQFISPILTPYTQAVTPSHSSASDTAANAQIWQYPSLYSQWFNNYLLSIDNVSIVYPGAGYTSAPVVTVTGTCVEQAVMTAIINTTGQIIEIIIDNPGSGYSTDATITISGGGLPGDPTLWSAGLSVVSNESIITSSNNIYRVVDAGILGNVEPLGTGTVINGTVELIYVGMIARAVAIMGNPLVRSFNLTLKYDRYEYQSTIIDWEANTTYENGTQVRYENTVWAANGTAGSVTNSVFDPVQWLRVEAGTLSGVDRTMGYYVGTVNNPGLSLPLLIDGIDYPGVQVSGIRFDQDTGFDRGNFDINPYDNISLDANGLPTYDLNILNTIFESSYLDPYLGIRPSSINIDGGKYVDVYESHAPEELVPGIEFDTLDLRVYTTPGADWSGLGHGFAQSTLQAIYNSSSPTISFAGLLTYPAALEIKDATQGYDLNEGFDYTVDWANQTITITNGSQPYPLIAQGDQLTIYLYEFGGGNQLYKNVYNGADVGNALVIPMQYNLIWNIVVFVNGVQTTEFTFSDNASTTFGTTLINFDNTYTSTDFISLVALGYTPTNISITNLAATGSIVTVSYDELDSTPFLVDQQITIADVIPDAYNGIYTVVSSTTTETTFTCSVDNEYIGGGTIYPVPYNWSLPVTQNLTVPATGQLSYNLDPAISLEYTNPVTAIVTIGGRVAVGNAGVPYVGDGTTRTYNLPSRVGVDSGAISQSNVSIYINGVLQSSSTYIVTAPVVTLDIAPALGTEVYITVDVTAQYIIDPIAKTLEFIPATGINPIANQTISVTTFNDTREQRLSQQIFVGPVTEGISIVQPFDSTTFSTPELISLAITSIESGSPSAGNVTINFDTQLVTPYFVNSSIIVSGVNPTTYNGTYIVTSCTVSSVTFASAETEDYVSGGNVDTNPASDGEYDATLSGATISVNNFVLYQSYTDIDRLWVSKNGRALSPYLDYTLDQGNILILNNGAINAADIVVITNVTSSIVPGAMEFRIFQDMRGAQAVYRMTPATTTTVTESVSSTDDIIYVDNATALTTPNFAANVWGVVTIGGERIMYRNIDFSTNTISSLLRGTAGTGADSHNVGDLVYNMGRDNLLPLEFQNYVDTESFLGNGTQTVFTSSLVVNDANYWSGSTPYDSTPFSSSADNGAYDPGLGSNSVAVEVYLGGTLQTSGYTLPNLDPVVVIFTTAPADGTEITIVVHKGHSWYNPGVDTASDGVPLQETNNAIARFLRGVN